MESLEGKIAWVTGAGTGIGDSDAVFAVAEAIRAAFGRLDVLVNNAGTNIPDRSWQRLTPGGVAQLINGNLTGAFYVAQAALGLMRAQRRHRGRAALSARSPGRLTSPPSTAWWR